MSQSLLTENCQIVNLLPPKDISAGAHSVAYISLKNYDAVEFIITMGATGGIGSSVAVTLREAKDTSGTSAANLPIGHYYTNAAAVASASTANDTWVRTTVASSGATFKLTPSTNNITYTIPVKAEQLSVDSSMDCVGVGVGTTGAATLCGCVAILKGSRYQSSSPPSALS